MDFNKIDEVVDRYYGKDKEATEIEEKLDQYDLEKLRAIYSRLTGKSGQLLRRHHLCEEIKESHETWKNRKKVHRQSGDLALELKAVLPWLLEDRHSFRKVEFSPNAPIDWHLFGCSDRDEFYQKCYDQLVFRSQQFSQIASSHRTLREHQCFHELFDLYFDTLYENYSSYPYLRDWLLVVIIALNLFRYHIVKLQLPHRYLFTESPVQCSDHSEKRISREEFPSNLRFDLSYDSEIERMGVFHARVPQFIEESGKHPVDEKRSKGNLSSNEDISEAESEEKESGPLISKEEIEDNLSYSHKYLKFESINLKFSPDVEKTSEEDYMEEIFSQL
jgi:hypothetical protein